MQRLKERVAIVTGGATGIGRATARLFAREGAVVCIFDVRAAEAEQTVTLIRGDGHHAEFVQCDVADGTAVHAAVAGVIARHGRVDVLHANAGIGLVRTLAETSEADWDRVLGVNLKGVYHCLRAVLPHMRRRRSGAIVITASPHALATYRAMAAYAASKGAVLALTRAVALDHARDGIRCNAILPGAIDTPMVRQEVAASPDPERRLRELENLQPVGRIGQPEDVAPAVLFLASDEAAFITGAALAVDGGVLARLGGE